MARRDLDDVMDSSCQLVINMYACARRIFEAYYVELTLTFGSGAVHESRYSALGRARADSEMARAPTLASDGPAFARDRASCCIM